MKNLIRHVFFLTLTGVALSACHTAQSAPPPKKVLFFSKSSGFEHDMIKQTNGQPSQAQVILTELGAKNNIEFTFTKDGSVFTPGNIAKYDGFCFYTTGDLCEVGNDKNPPMTPEGKAAFLEAIRNGKGFVGIHSATDSFHTPPGGAVDPYIKMIGAEFIKHDRQQTAHQIVVDKRFPGMSAVPDKYVLFEEWYTMKNFSPDIHVLLAQDTASMGRKGSYDRPNYPSTWALKYGKGRSFYTSMGHRLDVWQSPVFQSVLVGGFQWTLGEVDADVTPNINTATPGANTLQPGVQK
jgi:type 1 glutamine amidotransferase